jgi:anti-sigma factor RsiW
MSCKLQDTRPDWKAYALGELDAGSRREAELHAAACGACQE